MLKIASLPLRPTYLSTKGIKTETFPGWKWHSSSDAHIWLPAISFLPERKYIVSCRKKSIPRVAKVITELTFGA